MAYFKSLISAALGLSMLASPTLADFKRIKTEAQFREIVVDKKIYGDDGWAQAHSNGKLTGNYGGKNMSGAWLWSGQLWCRNARLEDGPETGSDCQTWEVNGNQLRLTREKGKGRVSIYEIK